jgi:sugar O-acyltransferase (sialic acid O-acetyltransferase NeuD family)
MNPNPFGNRVIFLGAASPHHKRLADVINHARGVGYCFDEWCGWLDDTKPAGGEFCGLPIMGGMSEIPRLVAEGYRFVNTISGSTVGRYETSRRVIDAGGKFVDFIHPTAEPFKHGISTYVQEEVGIQADVEVGDNCAIHARAFISHEVRIGHSCFVGAGVLAGRVQFNDGAYLGIGAVVLPDVRVGRWATIGAGAIVLRDVPDYAVMVGNPARQIKENPRVYDSGALT